MRKVFLFIVFIFSFKAFADDVALVRIGVSKGETRFVLDSKKKRFQYRLREGRDEIVVSFRSKYWDYISIDNVSSENKVIKSIEYNKNKGFLSISIDRNAKMKRYFDIKSSNRHRLVIDIINPTKKAEGLHEKTQVRKEYKRTSPSKKKIIVIDPGHGGIDPGALGYYKKTKEKEITLKYSLELEEILEKRGYEVHLTRRRDVYVKLHERQKYSSKKKADLFISIHADSHQNKNTHGMSVYTISENASQNTINETAQGVRKGIDFDDEIKNELIGLKAAKTAEQSVKFAQIIMNKADNGSVKSLTNPHRLAGFAVLKNLSVPSVLIELGFLSNKEEELKLANSKRYRNRILNLIADSVEEYFKN